MIRWLKENNEDIRMHLAFFLIILVLVMGIPWIFFLFSNYCEWVYVFIGLKFGGKAA